MTGMHLGYSLEKEIEFYKQRSEHFYFAAENAEIGLWFWDLKQGIIYSTPKCNEMFELDANEQITLHSIDHLLHPEDRETVTKTLEANASNNKLELKLQPSK